MPKIPKWWGDSIEFLFKKMLHSVQVSTVEYLTPALKKVTFSGDFSKVMFTAGNVVEFRITDTEFRHYTLSGFDKESCEIIFYLHDMGIGSRWADALDVGDNLKMIGPGGSLKYRSEFKRHLIFGDETCLGLMACMENQADAKGHSIFSIAEMTEGHETWAQFAGNEAVYVEASVERPAQAAIEAIGNDDFWHSTEDMFFYLAGRTKSIRAMKDFLLSKGVSPKQIKSEPYWNEGKSSL